MQFRQFAAGMVVAALLAGCSEQPADEVPAATGTSEFTALVEQRQDALENLSDANKALKAELEKDAPSFAMLGEQQAIVANVAGQFADNFPAGSGKESGLDTAALPAIWENRGVFDEAAARLQTGSDALGAAIAASDLAATRAAMEGVSASCRGCHDDFREKRD